MEDINNTIEQDTTLTDTDVFTKIWTSPRTVFRYIHHHHYDKYVAVLLVLSGIARAFGRASVRNIGDKLSLGAILALCIIMGGLIGWLSYYLYAALISWTGKWLKGRGNTGSILRVLSYAMIPSIVGLVMLIPQIAIYGVEVFKSDGDLTSAGGLSNILVYGSMVLEFVLAVWTLVLVVVGVSVVQHLSIGKSILNLLLPVLVILVPLLVVVWLVKSM